VLSHMVALGDTIVVSRTFGSRRQRMAKRYHRYRDDGTGNVYEKNGAFHVRWWTVEDGERRQKSKKLCDKDRDHASTRSKAVLDLAAAHMATTRAKVVAKKVPTVSEFFEQTYLPQKEKDCKPSTVHAINQIWNQHLKDHLGATPLNEYAVETATQFLTELAGKYSRNTVSHIKATASGIFTTARAILGKSAVEVNPWTDAMTLVRPRKGVDTQDYSLEEVEDAVTALVDQPELQLVVCLAGLAGLRRGEIASLRWEDFSERDGWVHVQRNLSREKVVDSPKTESSNRFVPLIAPLKLALKAWHRECRNVKEGWVFIGRYKERPGVSATRDRKIQDVFEKEKLPWKGMHAFRRSAATILTQLTKDPMAAAQMLGHKDTKITMEAYVKLHNQEVLAAAMKLFEQKVLTGGNQTSDSSRSSHR